MTNCAKILKCERVNSCQVEFKKHTLIIKPEIGKIHQVCTMSDTGELLGVLHTKFFFLSGLFSKKRVPNMNERRYFSHLFATSIIKQSSLSCKSNANTHVNQTSYTMFPDAISWSVTKRENT